MPHFLDVRLNHRGHENIFLFVQRLEFGFDKLTECKHVKIFTFFLIFHLNVFVRLLLDKFDIFGLGHTFFELKFLTFYLLDFRLRNWILLLDGGFPFDLHWCHQWTFILKSLRRPSCSWGWCLNRDIFWLRPNTFGLLLLLLGFLTGSHQTQQNESRWGTKQYGEIIIIKP